MLVPRGVQVGAGWLLLRLLGAAGTPSPSGHSAGTLPRATHLGPLGGSAGLGGGEGERWSVNSVPPRSLFAQCHPLAPPQHYYEACVFDTCMMPDSGLECASLQTYAALCAHEGVCIDWRNHTHGACRKCPPTSPDWAPSGLRWVCASLKPGWRVAGHEGEQVGAGVRRAG